MVTSPKQPSDWQPPEQATATMAGLGRRPKDRQDLAGLDLDVVDDMAGACEGGDEDHTVAAAGVGDVEYLAGGHVALASGLNEADAAAAAAGAR